MYFLIYIVVLISFCNCEKANESKLNNNWKIVIDNNASKVEFTAASDLQQFLKKKYSILLEIDSGETKSIEKKIVMGTTGTNTEIEKMISSGQLSLDTSKPEAFQIKTDAQTIYIAANDVRGVFYGTVFLEDYIEENGIENVFSLDTTRVPFFKHRSGGYLSSPQYKPENYSFDRYAKWLTHHYINYNGLHNGKTNLPDSVAEKYGICLYGGGSSNFFANLTDDYEKSPIHQWKIEHPEAISGTEPNYHTGKVIHTICIHTPFGREKHKEIIKNQLEESPQTKCLVYTFGDWGSICGKECIRCGKYALWQRIANWLKEVNTIVKEINPEVKVIGRTWYSTAVDSLIIHTPAGIGIRTKEPCSEKQYLATEVKETVFPDIMLVKKYLSPEYGPMFLTGAKYRGLDFFASTGIGNTGESIDPVIGFQTPYIAAFKIRRLADNNIRNMNIWWGGLDAWAYSANHEVIKEMIWDPFQNTDLLIEKIALKDFGKNLQPEVIKLWKTIDKAMEMWDYINWVQQFEEFVCRYDFLYLKPLIPDTIIETKWYERMWDKSSQLLPSQEKALHTLLEAEKTAKKIYEKASDKEIKIRAKQQFAWLKLFNHIFETQYHTIKIISMMETYYNPETDKNSPDFSELTANQEYKTIINDEIENCKNTIETVKFINYPNFKFYNQRAKAGQEKAIGFLNEKIYLLKTWKQEN